MNRAEFMRRLSVLLNDVPPAERDEALQYYNDYFDDAGVENETGVIASLGTPEELARLIKAGLNDGQNAGEFTESGYSAYTQTRRAEMMNPQDAATDDYYRRTGGRGIYGGQSSRKTSNPYEQQSNTANSQTYGNTGNNAGGSAGGSAGSGAAGRKRMSGGTIALLVIFAILTFPLWGSALGVVFSIVAGVFAALFGIFAAFLAIGIALIVAAAALFVTGIVLLFAQPLPGVCVLGSSFIVFALGLVFLWLMVMLAGLAIPAVVRLIGALGRRIFHRGGCAA